MTVKVEYKKVPGKNWGLHVQGGSRAVRDALVRFVVSNNQWLTAQHHGICRKAHPFIQSDSYGDVGGFGSKTADDSMSYLFIEFWSSMEDHAEFMSELLKAAQLELDPYRPEASSETDN
jgi:hypothetical protein